MIASWYVELAILRVLELVAQANAATIVSAEDVGIQRVRINPDY